MAITAQQIRMGEQAFLMLHLKEILDATKKVRVKNPAGQVGSTRDYDRTKVNYSNFSCLRNGVPGHFDLTSNFTKNSNMAYLINKLPPQFLNALLPSIKLYKVFYQDKSSASTNREEYEWRIPFDNSFVKHDPYTSEYVADSIENVLKGTGKMNGAGIKSFKYDYLGTNPADIVSNIKAELEIYFQSVEDLINKLQFNGSDTRFVGKKPNSTSIFSFSYSDLVGVGFNKAPASSPSAATGVSPAPANTVSPIPSNLQPNLQYFRIRAEIGYADLDDNYYHKLGKYFNNVFSNPADVKKAITSIKDAISATKVILMLTPIAHDLKFNEDATISLKIEYYATLDSILYSADADILRLGEDHEKIVKIRKALNDLLVTRQKEIDKIKSTPCIDEKQIEAAIDELNNTDPNIGQANIEDYRKKLYEKEEKYYDSLYQTLIGANGLATSRQVGTSPLPYGLYTVIYNDSQIGLNAGLAATIFEREFSDSESAGLRLNRMSAKPIGVDFIQAADYDNTIKNFIPDATELNNVITSGFLQTIQSWFSSNEEAPDDEQINKGLEEYYDKNLKEYFTNTNVNSSIGKSLSNTKNKEMYFLFLGDILDCVLDVVFRNNPALPNDYTKIKKFITIVGDMKIKLPLKQKLENKLGQYSPFAEKKELIVNLADIPISVSMFQNFLFEKIVRPRRETYPVGLFIKDIISDLLFPAISPSYLAKNITENTHINFSTFYLTLPISSKNNVDPILGIDPKSNAAMPFITSANVAAIKALAASNKGFNIKNAILTAAGSADYYFLYCSSQIDVSKLNAIEEDDNKKRIYHLRMGIDTGIVKSISFSKTDTPFYREALAHQDGMSDVHMLKQVYDAEIKMFGNDIYKPGDILYIEPYFNLNKNPDITTSHGTKLLRQIDLSLLNIDGYYMVNKVSSTINDNIYETKLNCIKKASKSKDPNKKVVEENEGC